MTQEGLEQVSNLVIQDNPKASRAMSICFKEGLAEAVVETYKKISKVQKKIDREMRYDNNNIVIQKVYRGIKSSLKRFTGNYRDFSQLLYEQSANIGGAAGVTSAAASNFTQLVESVKETREHYLKILENHCIVAPKAANHMKRFRREYARIMQTLNRINSGSQRYIQLYTRAGQLRTTILRGEYGIGLAQTDLNFVNNAVSLVENFERNLVECEQVFKKLTHQNQRMEELLERVNPFLVALQSTGRISQEVIKTNQEVSSMLYSAQEYAVVELKRNGIVDRAKDSYLEISQVDLIAPINQMYQDTGRIA